MNVFGGGDDVTLFLVLSLFMILILVLFILGGVCVLVLICKFREVVDFSLISVVLIFVGMFFSSFLGVLVEVFEVIGSKAEVVVVVIIVIVIYLVSLCDKEEKLKKFWKL